MSKQASCLVKQCRVEGSILESILTHLIPLCSVSLHWMYKRTTSLAWSMIVFILSKGNLSPSSSSLCPNTYLTTSPPTLGYLSKLLMNLQICLATLKFCGNSLASVYTISFLISFYTPSITLSAFLWYIPIYLLSLPLVNHLRGTGFILKQHSHRAVFFTYTLNIVIILSFCLTSPSDTEFW